MSFANLKRNKDKSLEKLNKEVEKLNGQRDKSGGDDRFWKLTVDQAGNGSAVIRFLPAPTINDVEEPVPFVRVFNHGFKGPTGKWYIEDSLTTIGQKDPVYELNGQLYNASEDKDSWQRKQASAQKRKVRYISNIYVVKDSANPENEGKVFLYSYGKKIFDKLNDLMNPGEDDIEPQNPFDFWNGSNFRLRQRKVDGWPNFDKSTFDSPSELLGGDDEALEELYNKQYSLQAFLDPKNYKTYEELEKRLNEVLGKDSKTVLDGSKKSEPKQSREAEEQKTREEDDIPFIPDSSSNDSSSEDDDDMSFFKSLVEESETD
ncbi:single stranded DNA-binding protein [Caulobacter phage Cr30]|uniref:single strand DNA binding protein n=1 Tax=Caulobacter phage Cr30 TaxID=1357714 RepID=UPI0004A9B662|nr:single strand DNA binding protein [Caulobacter phage Cr30]AGS81140.1 single stranded DNA-binding protein [Caulobacter phage Cr30]